MFINLFVAAEGNLSIRCCAKIVNLAIRQKKRRSDSASVTLHDETKSHHRRAAEGRYTGRSPVHQLRRRAPRRWPSAKRRVRVDQDVHRLESPGRPRVSRESSGVPMDNGVAHLRYGVP